MSTDSNKQLIRGFIDEVWNEGQLAMVDEMMPTTLINHFPDGHIVNRDGFMQFVRALRTAFPDFHMILTDLIAEADRVVARWVWHGTHRGQLLEMQPTGKHAQIEGVCIYRLADGCIAEVWWAYDTATLMQQLGFVPSAPRISIG